ncbi:response regulator [Mariprofundus ferrooxydans]|nr:response regulator [Mariprofundus ferrooxydans]
MNQYVIENWLLKQGQINDQSLSKTQIEQAYARLAFAGLGLLYLFLHAESFAYYQNLFLAVSAAYFLITLLSIPAIRLKPLSAYRLLLFPLFDTFVVSFAMLIDDGPTSGLYFLLLVVIFGNSFRFGNTMLRYSQFCTLTALVLMITYAQLYTSIAIDYTLLGWQIGALLIIPLYISLVGQKAEDALKMQTEAEESSFHLMDKGPLPVFTFKLTHKQQATIMYSNAAMRDLFHYDHDQLIETSVDQLALNEDRQELLRFCQSTLKPNANEQHNAQSMYLRAQDNEGNLLKLMITAISMRWRNNTIGVCFIYDITQRETMQEEMESVHRHAYMSTLVAGIVHDFRNVLTNMIGYAEVMQMNSSSASEKQQLQTIIAAGDRGAELITHLLSLGKNTETEPMPHFTEGHVLVKPLQHIIGLARLQLPQHIQLICTIDDPLHDVAISMTEIEQILLNLINNSTQAIVDHGHIEIQIRNEAKHKLAKPGHPCLCIHVNDNGSGIAEENLDTIFKPFWTSKSSQGGSGLGLTMVQRIIKRNHGCIDVQSSSAKGTSFSIHLPPYIADPKQKAIEQLNNDAGKNKSDSPAMHAKQHNPLQHNQHALIVDDVPDILKIHQAMLARMNITSETAENGQIALELFQQQKGHFNLIITDYKMPKMDGLKLIEHIRHLDEQLPIVMISAFAEDHQLQQVIGHNVTLLNKPINMEKLKEAIVTAIAG